MIRWRDGVVTAVRREWPGAVELDVAVPGEDDCRALAYPALTGRPELGDRVLLNTTALAPGRGTGGYAFVVAVPGRLPPDAPPGPGHVVKARYTPQHEVLRDADDLGGMPVVVADLHSALPAVLAGTRRSPRPRRPTPLHRHTVLASRSSHRGRAASRRVRHAGRRGAPGLVLPDLRRAARGRLAGGHGHDRAGVRR